MAVARLLELGKDEIGCVSTGNVGTAVAALAAKAGATAYIFYPGNMEKGKAQGLPGARRPGLPARRQLRPGQPRLPRALAGERHRVRQHHPAPVLRRGGEDDGLRGRRAARLELAGPLRDPGGGRNALLAGPQGAERARDRRPGGDRRDQDQHRPGQRLRADRDGDPRGRRDRAADARTRPPTRWRSAPPATARWSSTRCARRGGSAATVADEEIFAGDRSARRDRGRPHRAGRRHHGRGHGEARRRRARSAPRRPSSP